MFLGDYVDRGLRGVEVLQYLMAVKINHPKKMWLLRGNHETRNMTTSFTFRQEVLEKYDAEVYDAFMEMFDSFPIAAVVNGLYLCLHGGISPELFEVADINNKINRFQEPPNLGLLCDILWSDPVDDSVAPEEVTFTNNDVRQCSFMFGLQPIKSLLRRERLLSLIRAHEVKSEGYEMNLWEDPDDFPLVITVFSAPNYCNSYGNKAAIIMLNNSDSEQMEIKQFDCNQKIQPPYMLPGNMDVFAWSAPFLAECVSQMFYAMLSRSTTVYNHEEEKQSLDQ